ncbi:hypothetical protein [Pseudonocardia sp. H11422]|uniref:hypothetical protein n=1 Tax=Pseudonocardia sp. H11422 TaxID=2835866 RepID=UPI001BDD0396|nr:hypothetical protein [Pseudonocardia sp. H11422]
MLVCSFESLVVEVLVLCCSRVELLVRGRVVCSIRSLLLVWCGCRRVAQVTS